MITFISLMDKGHSPVVNNCPLFIVLQTALLFLLVWAPPVVGNSSTWDTQRPLDRTATLCDRELVFVTVCASTGGHQRQYGRKFGDRSRSILVSTFIKQTWLVVMPLTILLPILDLNFVCVCLLHCTCILCFKCHFCGQSQPWFGFSTYCHSQDHHLDTDRFCRLNLDAKHRRRPMQSFF